MSSESSKNSEKDEKKSIVAAALHRSSLREEIEDLVPIDSDLAEKLFNQVEEMQEKAKNRIKGIKEKYKDYRGILIRKNKKTGPIL
ncbi:MAG: hypothetical protein KAU62_00565, partial [Candidatus Heimdallarchaeota archaeon]|nr:hypothetical protein [Candidatus Heimdallarchaeota archaeon]MCK4609624.1 hypothetical protein [Candidatus Heimdallarchaeota archaeon]